MLLSHEKEVFQSIRREFSPPQKSEKNNIRCKVQKVISGLHGASLNIMVLLISDFSLPVQSSIRNPWKMLGHSSYLLAPVVELRDDWQ